MNNNCFKELNNTTKIIGGNILKNVVSLLLALNISLFPIQTSNIFKGLFPKKNNYNLNSVEIGRASCRERV